MKLKLTLKPIRDNGYMGDNSIEGYAIVDNPKDEENYAEVWNIKTAKRIIYLLNKYGW